MGSLNYLPDVPDPAVAHSVPLDNPLHGPPPARFKDGEPPNFDEVMAALLER